MDIHYIQKRLFIGQSTNKQKERRFIIFGGFKEIGIIKTREEKLVDK